MKREQHWNIIDKDNWPTIQSTNQTDPFIIFSNQTALGSSAAYRWAELVCNWMNFQMSMGNGECEVTQSDPVLLCKLHETEEKLSAKILECYELKKDAQIARETMHKAIRTLSKHGID